MNVVLASVNLLKNSRKKFREIILSYCKNLSIKQKLQNIRKKVNSEGRESLPLMVLFVKNQVTKKEIFLFLKEFQMHYVDYGTLRRQQTIPLKSCFSYGLHKTKHSGDQVFLRQK